MNARAEGDRLAVTAEALYLANLLLLPGIAFAALVWIYRRRMPGASPLARHHLRQTVSATIWAGIFLVVANAVIVVLGGYDQPSTWVVVIVYFTVCHATLVLLGALGLSRAMAGQRFRFPLIGGLLGREP
ncbi:MAG: hypothetical protein H6983_08075 [Ectothiorhodospiraceae bacterium]|nr:hypothetical protein [Chromatiales bacterium]MCP5154105.1 hypothetical protein [Ectothiorhodospiraceae bacterium]